MKPGDELFDGRRDTIATRSGELAASVQLAGIATSVADKLVENAKKAEVAGLTHVRTAVQRALNQHGITFPKGDAFCSEDYDVCPLPGGSNDKFFNQLYRDRLDSDLFREQEVASRIYTVSGPKNKKTTPKEKIQKFLGGDSPGASNALIHTITALDAGEVFDPQSITFVVVWVTGGLSYCFTIESNPNLGKVIPQYGMQTEHGDMRDTTGYIDYCPFRAVPIDLAGRSNVTRELHTLNNALATPEQSTKKDRPSFRKKLGARATTTITAIKGIPVSRSLFKMKNT